MDHIYRLQPAALAIHCVKNSPSLITINQSWLLCAKGTRFFSASYSVSCGRSPGDVQLWSLFRVSLQHNVTLVMMLSTGLSECIQRGRWSQVCSHQGRRWGFCDCSLFKTTMQRRTVIHGTQIPTRTCHPATERAKTMNGRRRKQRIRYSTANHLYFDVRSPKNRAMRMGRRLRGTGYQSNMPRTLKMKWHRATWGIEHGLIYFTNCIMGLCCESSRNERYNFFSVPNQKLDSMLRFNNTYENILCSTGCKVCVLK